MPAIADATSLQYVMHASVGDELRMNIGGSTPLVLRFVASLRDSVLQSELIIGEEAFLRLFPAYQGFRFFLIESPGITTSEEARNLAQAVERVMAPLGVDAVSTTERLAAFHSVENTYLSTFQALGGLGLLLGTVGLATVMFRNVLERRREIALLRAVGYDGRHVSLMMTAEVALLIGAGLAVGYRLRAAGDRPRLAWPRRLDSRSRAGAAVARDICCRLGLGLDGHTRGAQR